ncbi:Uncharacterized protein XB17_03199 [Leptospira santarosai]|nr:Uncharacterized protein XB17_03199 [Leptospira santarosai]
MHFKFKAQLKSILPRRISYLKNLFYRGALVLYRLFFIVSGPLCQSTQGRLFNVILILYSLHNF